MKKLFRTSVSMTAALVATAGFAALLTAQQIRTPRQVPPPVNPDFTKMQVQTLPVQGKVYLIAGGGGNVVVQVGDDGVLAVDTGWEKMSDKIIPAIRKLSTKPIRTTIITTLADDHTGGNAPFVKEGFQPINNMVGPGLGGRPNEGDLVGHANLLRLMTEIGPDKIHTDRWPPSTFHGRSKDLFFNDEPIFINHVPNAVTAGDVMVFFRRSDVLVTGDIFNQTSFPYIDVEHGGTINGVIEGLNQILEIAVPKHLQEGGTMIVPGHGRISDEHDALEYRDMVTIVRDRVQNAMKKGMTLQQIKAVKPSFTYEYEPRFGKNPAWTPEMFIEAIYKTLGGK